MRIPGNRHFVVVICLAFLVAAGCAAQPQVRGKSPGAGGAGTPSVQRDLVPEYRLGVGDVVEVKFFNSPRFNETVALRPDGRITLEKAGDILAAGMTPSSLDSLITDIYALVLREREVTVIVREFGGNQIYVLGEVNRPGAYPVQQKMTVLQAVAAAGGTKISAKMQSVVVLRRQPESQENGFIVDLTQSLNRKKALTATLDPNVHPQDIVYVPKTAFASVNDFMAQAWAGLLRPVDIYLNFYLRDFNNP